MKKTHLNEEIETSGENFINYISVIDSTEILNNNRSMLNFIFPDVKINKMITWYDKFAKSEQYQNKEDRTKLEAINSRFYGDGTLKLLYRSLNALLIQPERVNRDKDVKKLIRKIGTYIKQRLTDDDKAVIQKMFPALQSTDNIIEDKIEQILLKSMQQKQEPDEEPSKETEERPDGVDIDKKGKKVNERVKNKLRKKIKEMVRTHLITARYG